jgi:hypothetical protein
MGDRIFKGFFADETFYRGSAAFGLGLLSRLASAPVIGVYGERGART